MSSRYTLRREGRFYLDDRDWTGTEPYPRLFDCEGKRLYRFMDRIFSLKPIACLSVAEVRELCELRLRFESQIVRTDVYDAVAQAMLNVVRHCARGVVLDFGCGSGKFTREICKIDGVLAVSGCDISYEALQLARDSGLNVCLVSHCGTLPFQTGSIDALTACFVCHFELPVTVLHEIVRVVKPGGDIVISRYGRAGTVERLKRQPGVQVVRERLVPKCTGHSVLHLRRNHGIGKDFGQ